MVLWQPVKRTAPVEIPGGEARVARVRPALGTYVALEAVAGREARALGAIEAAWSAVRLVEALMHPSRPGSDVAAINAAPVDEPVAVHAWTREVLVLARVIGALSEGLFDPCLPGSAGRICDLDVKRPGHAIRRADLCLDLGGIAKGFAVDKAVDAMRAAGCTSGIVNAGGDLRVFGAARNIPVRIAGSISCEVVIENAALAVSDPASSDRPPEHCGYYTRAGVRSDRKRPAVVKAPTAAVADALTKCVLLGLERPMSELAARLHAVIVDMNLS